MESEIIIIIIKIIIYIQSITYAKANAKLVLAIGLFVRTYSL